MSDQTPTDPWNDIYEGIAFNYEDDKLITAIELARAAEREQHQREIAQRDETIRQLQAQIATLTQERDDFHMRYRIQCDVESKAALVRAEAAEARCATLTTALTEAQQQRDTLREAAAAALREMCNTVAPRNSFTDAVDALDAALASKETPNGE